MWNVLALVSVCVGILIIFATINSTSWIGGIIGIAIMIIGPLTFLTIDYCNTKIIYKVEMQTQEVLSANGKDYAIRLRIYRDGKYYDIEMPIDEYHGETELTFTQKELSKYK